jgi:membrane protease YdiL (CAAX protease family)
MVPAWVFSYLATPRPAAYIGLRAPGKKIQLLLAITLMLGIMPVLQLIEGLISQINFSPAIKAQQAASESMMNAFLTMPSFGAFVKTFIIVAIVPAVGEEFFFRGVLLRFARKPSRNMVGPVIFTAVVFSLTHANIYGYLSIFIAGVVLAMIYYFTGSLWCSILAHLFFNGSQVVLSYLSTNNASVKAFLSNTSVPFWYVAAGLAVFVGSYYLLLKNKTPLPDDWTNDFLPEELEPTTE